MTQGKLNKEESVEKKKRNTTRKTRSTKNVQKETITMLEVMGKAVQKMFYSCYNFITHR